MAAALNYLDLVIDSRNGGVSKHLGQIADFMSEWEGRIAECLELTPADVSSIKLKHSYELRLQIREGLEKWKQNLGHQATYQSLIEVFESAGYHGYADFVRNINFDESSSTAPLPTIAKQCPIKEQNLVMSKWNELKQSRCTLITLTAVGTTVILVAVISLVLAFYRHDATGQCSVQQMSPVATNIELLLEQLEKSNNNKRIDGQDGRYEASSKSPSYYYLLYNNTLWITILSCSSVIVLVVIGIYFRPQFLQKYGSIVPKTSAPQTPKYIPSSTNNSLLTKQEEELINNPESKGPHVVNLCIRKLKSKTFRMLDDNNMLRRIAYVMSDFGNDIQNNGGIWQVSYYGFRDTMDTATHVRLPQKYLHLSEAFGIDWKSVTYKDLEKPFYSALAARLFLSNYPQLIPPAHQVEKQAIQWNMYYLRGEGDTQMFVNKVNELEN